MTQISFLETDKLIEQYHQKEYFPDASYAIFSTDKILHQGVCGRAASDTWFDLASLTKLYTSTAVLKLINQGDVTLKDSPADRLPIRKEYLALYELLKPVTIEELLTHTSGLLPWFPFYTQKKDFYPVLEDLLIREPRLEGMNYSDINFILLGKIIEQCLNCNLPEALSKLGLSMPEGPAYFPAGDPLQRRLLEEDKIAISSYGNGIEEKMCADRSLSFAAFRSSSIPVIGQPNDGNCWYYFRGISGHAGLFAPVSALVKLGQLYLSSNDPLLKEAMEDRGMGRGLGFEVDEKYPMGCGHTGFTGTSLWLSPQNGVGAAMLTNRLAYEGGQQAKDLSIFRKEFHRSVLKDLNLKSDI